MSGLSPPHIVIFLVIGSITGILQVVSMVTNWSSRMDLESGNCVPLTNKTSTKLLILLLDGFRWDYYQRYKQHLPGFQRFIDEGVQAEYVEPMFPSLSLPAWMTLTTGLFPAYHNVLGNQMLHRADEEYPEMIFDFLEDSSKHEMWWKSAEPLWITATKRGLRSYLAEFARCDTPFQGLLPEDCTGYNKDAGLNLRKHLSKAVLRFREGYSLGMIYNCEPDIPGHHFGPGSENVFKALLSIDKALQDLLQELEMYGLENKVNVVITSDHGTTDISNVTRIKLGDYLPEPNGIYKVVGCDGMSMIYTVEGETDSVYDKLLLKPGIVVYKKNDIPNEFHFKESYHVPDILVLAKANYLIVGLKGNKQIPESCAEERYFDDILLGTHGYHNMTDMRSIFYGRGPDFKKGLVIPPIRLEDQYQVFMHILGLETCTHNGTWSHVVGMFN